MEMRLLQDVSLSSWLIRRNIVNLFPYGIKAYDKRWQDDMIDVDKVSPSIMFLETLNVTLLYINTHNIILYLLLLSS